jgi:hypothetical protein
MTATGGPITRTRTRAWLLALLGAAAALALLPQAYAQREPCNPVIDGTYCAEQMPRTRSTPSQSAPMISPLSDLGRSISGDPSSPGTLGGFSVRSGGTTCMGLLRRGVCN